MSAELAAGVRGVTADGSVQVSGQLPVDLLYDELSSDDNTADSVISSASEEEETNPAPSSTHRQESCHVTTAESGGARVNVGAPSLGTSKRPPTKTSSLAGDGNGDAPLSEAPLSDATGKRTQATGKRIRATSGPLGNGMDSTQGSRVRDKGVSMGKVGVSSMFGQGESTSVREGKVGVSSSLFGEVLESAIARTVGLEQLTRLPLATCARVVVSSLHLDTAAIDNIISHNRKRNQERAGLSSHATITASRTTSALG